MKKPVNGFLNPIVVLGIGVPVALLAIGVVPRIIRNAALQDEVRQRRDAAPTVMVTHPREAPQGGLALPGSSVAMQEVVLQARGTGYVTKSNVDIGSVVKAGQVLAVLQAPDIDAQYAQASAQTHQSASTVSQSRTDALRLAASDRQAKAMFRSTQGGLAAAKATAVSYAAKLATARRALRQAEANLRADQATLEYNNHEADRYRVLGHDGYATIEQVEQQVSTAKSTTAKVEADKEAVEVARSNINDAEAAYHAAVASVDAATFNVTSAQENIEVTDQALASGLRQIEINQHALSAASQNENRYGAVKALQVITAPFAGVITARNVEVGSLVNASTAPVADTDPSNTVPTSGLYGLARLDPLEVAVQVPQTFYSAAQVGQKVDVTFRELPDEVFHGKISLVSGALDATSRTIQVKVSLANPKARLRPGMYADVHFNALKQDTVLRVPSTAFAADAHGTHIDVVTPDKKIEVRPVRVGRDFGDEAEILSGLKASDMIVITPSDALAPGMTVEPSEPKVVPTSATTTASKKG